MKASYFQEATVSMGAPKNWDEKTQGVCHNLCVHVSGDGTCISLWKPSKKDLELLNNGGFVRLGILGGQPPVWVDVPNSEEETFFNDIPNEDQFENCKKINHAIEGINSRNYTYYKDWVDAILHKVNIKN